MRTIKVFSSKRDNLTEINSDAKSWGQLKAELTTSGYSLDGLIASENITRCTLEHSEAVLPEGEFTLFLRQKDGKGGADLTFSQLRELAKTNSDFKAYLVANSTNWTQLSTAKLNELHEEFLENTEEACEGLSDNMTIFKEDLGSFIEDYEDTDADPYVAKLREIYDSIIEEEKKEEEVDPTDAVREEYEIFVKGLN